MKNSLFLGLAFGMSVSAFAQEAYHTRILKRTNPITPDYQVSFSVPPRVVERKSPLIITNNAITVVPIGTSGNCYGQAFGPRTNVWVDPRLNTVIVIHRLTGLTGQNPSLDMFGVDISMDGGATFTNNIKVYDPAGTPAGAFGRFPQVGIYNPPGNTVATNAFAAYYGSSLAGTNGADWGGTIFGAVKLDGTGANQLQITDNRSFMHENFKIKQNGDAIVMTRESVGSTVYTDTVIVAKGTWNGTTNSYDYTRSRMSFPIGKVGAEGTYAAGDVAFANDGMTGFYVNISHPGFTLNPDSVFIPLIWKTTDGGSSWTYLGALDLNAAGIVSALNLPAATRITTGFEVDITVDSKNDLHIVTALTPKAEAFSIRDSPGQWGVFDIRTTDGGVGTAWSACLLGKPSRYRGGWGVSPNRLDNDSRGQSSRTWDGDKVFFMYLDTDTLTYGSNIGNTSPDAWIAGYDVVSGKWMPVKNATILSGADGSCNFGMLGEYVFGTTGTYKIPLAYTMVTNILDPSQMNYVDGLEVSDAEFSANGNCTPVSFLVVGVNEIVASTFSVSDNYPNPFSKITNVKVSISKSSDIILEVYNALGQKMMSQKAYGVASGNYTFLIDGAKLNPGIYFYTVSAGEKSVTRKMIVNE